MNRATVVNLPTTLGGATHGPKLPATGYKPPNLVRTVQINFDNLADKTVIDSAYVDYGVTFASLTTNPPSRGSAYSRRMDLATALSGKNVLSLSTAAGWTGPFFDARQGAVEATFEQLVHSVSVSAFPLNMPESLGNDDNRPFLEAFDAAGKYLGRALTAAGPNDPDFFCRWQPITFVSPQRNIKSIRLSSQAHGSRWVYTVFDNLTYDVLLIPKTNIGP